MNGIAFAMNDSCASDHQAINDEVAFDGSTNQHEQTGSSHT